MLDKNTLKAGGHFHTNKCFLYLLKAKVKLFLCLTKYHAMKTSY